MTDIAMASYIKRCTNGGTRIGAAPDTIMTIRNGVHIDVQHFFTDMAARRLIVIEQGDGATIQARVNYGRWCCVCDCGGCEDVDPALPVFLCLSCGNDGHLRPVVFPEQRTEIERVLLLRTSVADRNWEPWETVDDLLAQNQVMGYPTE